MFVVHDNEILLSQGVCGYLYIYTHTHIYMYIFKKKNNNLCRSFSSSKETVRKCANNVRQSYEKAIS